MSALDTLISDAKQVADVLQSPSKSANAGAALGGVLSYQFSTVQSKLADAYNGFIPKLRAFIPGLGSAASGNVPPGTTARVQSPWIMPLFIGSVIFALLIVLRKR